MTRADLVVVAAAAALVGALFARYWTAPVPASTFELRSGERLVGRYPLTLDRRLEVNGQRGISIVEVRAGRVRFRTSPCRNQVCVHSGWLAHGGEVAACLPNRVTLRLFGEAAAIDAVSY